MPLPLVLGLCGFARSGKSTIAQYLVEHHDFVRVRFAGPLKDMLRTLGLSEAQLEGDLKNEPCDLLRGQTPRWAMQTLGTEWGRVLIGHDLWTHLWREATLSALIDGKSVVVDDLRFLNEAQSVRRIPDSQIWRVSRLEVSTPMHHSSEQELARITCDRTIYNDSSIEELLDYVKAQTT